MNAHPYCSHMVAERGRTRISERIERVIVDALVPLILEEIVEVARSISQEHIQRRIVDEIEDVSVPQNEDNNDQLSNTTARIEAVEKSISELHERVTKDTKIRQKQNSEVMMLPRCDGVAHAHQSNPYRRLWKFRRCSILTGSSVYRLPRKSEFLPFKLHRERWQHHRFNSLIERQTSLLQRNWLKFPRSCPKT